MTNLQPEQPARLPNFGEGMRWGEAIRSLWPDSELHGESLPAVPVLELIKVQNNHITAWVRPAMCAQKARDQFELLGNQSYL